VINRDTVRSIESRRIRIIVRAGLTLRSNVFMVARHGELPVYNIGVNILHVKDVVNDLVSWCITLNISKMVVLGLITEILKRCVGHAKQRNIRDKGDRGSNPCNLKHPSSVP
jgi:hypothetical protein